MSRRRRKKNRQNKQPLHKGCHFWDENPQIVRADHECKRINCATCVKYNRETQKCKDEEEVVRGHEDLREYEELMRHDGYVRRGGSLRQVRR